MKAILILSSYYTEFSFWLQPMSSMFHPRNFFLTEEKNMNQKTTLTNFETYQCETSWLILLPFGRLLFHVKIWQTLSKPQMMKFLSRNALTQNLPLFNNPYLPLILSRQIQLGGSNEKLDCCVWFPRKKVEIGFIEWPNEKSLNSVLLAVNTLRKAIRHKPLDDHPHR